MCLNFRSTELSQVNDILKAIYLYTGLPVNDLVMTSFLRMPSMFLFPCLYNLPAEIIWNVSVLKRKIGRTICFSPR